MKRPKYYFESNDSEICYTEDHFHDLMDYEKWSKMELFEAIPERIQGVFWCKVHSFCADDTADTCGRQCDQYEPRNRKNGCCKHHCSRLYTHGNPVTLYCKYE